MACRLCLTEDCELVSLSETRSGFPISVIAMIICPVKIFDDDSLPKDVCIDCLEVLISAYKLRDISLRSETYMTQKCIDEPAIKQETEVRGETCVFAENLKMPDTKVVEMDQVIKMESDSHSGDLDSFHGETLLTSEYFLVVGGKGKCLFCSAEFVHQASSSGNLTRHLRKSHAAEWKKYRCVPLKDRRSKKRKTGDALVPIKSSKATKEKTLKFPIIKTTSNKQHSFENAPTTHKNLESNIILKAKKMFKERVKKK